MVLHSDVVSERTAVNRSRTLAVGLTERQSRPSKPWSRSKNLLHSLSLPALILDDEAYVIDANPAAIALLNKPAREIISRKVTELLTLETEAVSRCCDDQTQTTEMVLRDAEDNRYLELTFSPLHNAQGLSGHLILFNDVTERKRDDLARNSMIDTLESYASAIAHDLKSPLATVMGFASLLEMAQNELSEDHRHYARTIQKISSKMATMIDKLLLFATLEKLEHIPLLPLDMSKMAAEVLETLHAVVKQYDAHVTVVPDMPQVIGYVPWIEVVFANLISNAIKYGGTSPKVVVSASQIGSKVYFWIHDNGRGLTDEQMEMLFHQSVRFDGRPRGHGQGLLIARRIVERLGGEIGVSSLLGTGSTFYFTLPAAHPEVPQAHRPIETEAVRVD